MMDYVTEYHGLLKETIKGAKVRALFFGYTSERLSNYVDSQKQKLFGLNDQAYDAGQEIQTRKNLDLGQKLFDLEVRIDKAELNLV
jgi:hypothetical protein